MALSQTPVKFYRGLNTAYTASIDTWKDGIFFSMDEHVIYHNGIKFGGIDPKHFEGTTKDFDINGSTVTFKKLNNKGTWDDITIKLVKAVDNSIVIDNLVNDDNVTDGFTVKVKAQYAAADADGLKLGNEGLYVDFSKTNTAIEANKAAIDVLKGADTVEGSVAKSVKDAVDALYAAEVGGKGKVITTISENNGVIAATAIDLTAESVAATTISASEGTTVAVTGDTVASQISSLAKSIESVSSAAKSYRIASITDETEVSKFGENVREAYQLVDEDNKIVGDTIKIYKDSSLQSVALTTGGTEEQPTQFLTFTYILDSGKKNVVNVDVSSFLAESEFKNGLEVVNGVVNVKIDTASEGNFLTVGADGVKLSGVQDAINSAAAKATTKVEKDGDADKITLASSTADGHLIYTIGQNDIASAKLLGNANDNTEANTAFGKIAKEVADREAATQAQTTALNAEIAARKAVDGVNGDTYPAQSNANYISKASSLFDADVKLDAAIKTVADTAAKAHTEVTAKPDGHVRVAVAKSNDGSHDVVTVSEDDIASATALTKETAAREAQDNIIEASIGLDAEGNHKKTSGNYTSGASTIAGEIAALDTKLKAVSDTLLWIDCGDYSPSQA